MSPTFLAMTGAADISGLLTVNGLTVAGILTVAVIVLWRLYIQNAKKDREAAAKTAEAAETARHELISTLKASHEEAISLLKLQLEDSEEQSESLLEDLRTERTLHEKEWREHIQRMEDITAGYRQSLEAFRQSMNEVQGVLKEQTSLLREIAGLPQKVDQLAKDVNALWEVQHERDENEKRGRLEPVQ
jgi:DNA-binding ferritin-like protein (Dps family)